MYTAHADTFEDSAGIQYLVFSNQTETPCEVSTASYQLSKGLNIMQPVELGGGKRKIVSLWKCPFPANNGGTDEHIGCAKNVPRCVISTVAPFRSATDPPQRYPHATEIILIQGNGIEIRRLAETRSVRFKEEGSESYWAQPRAAISNDGSLVVFDTNFGMRGATLQPPLPNAARVVVALTEPGRPAAAQNAGQGATASER
jgi:hypothetical protein